MRGEVLGFRGEVSLVECRDGFEMAAPLWIEIQRRFQGLSEVSGEFVEVAVSIMVCGGGCWRGKEPDCTG